MAIHPLSVVDPRAQIHPDAIIGPFCYIQGPAIIAAGVELRSHVSVFGRSSIGGGSILFPGAVIGSDPQDVKYKGEDSEAIVGANCRIHECVTISKGTTGGGMKTVVGDNCLIMAYAHVGHDTVVHERVIIGNGAQLAGHSHIGRKATINALAGIHQFTTVGELAYIGAMSPVTMDIPPFMVADGDPCEPRNVNVVGLRRDGWSEAHVDRVRSAFRAIYRDPENRPVRVCAGEFLDGLADDASDPAFRLATWIKEHAERAKKGRILESERALPAVGVRPNHAQRTTDNGNVG